MGNNSLRTDEYAQKEKVLITSYREIKDQMNESFKKRGMDTETSNRFTDSLGNYVNSLATPEKVNIFEDTVENLKEVLISVDKMDDDAFKAFTKAMNNRLTKLRKKRDTNALTSEEYNTTRRRMYRVLFAQLGKGKYTTNTDAIKK